MDKMNNDMLKIWVSEDPLKKSLQLAEVPTGQTLKEITGGAPVEAWVDGVLVDAYYMEHTIVPQDSIVLVYPIPAGSRDAWRTVASIAVTVVAVVVTAVLTPVIGPIFSGLIGGVVMAGGYGLINWLLPMIVPGAQPSFNRLSALTGQQNRTGAYVPIPRLYGRMRYYPPIPMTAPPHTELLGGDQYLRMLLCLGHGPLAIGGVTVGPGKALITQDTALTGTPIKIGETDINEYEGVAYQIGRPDQIDLYSNQVIESHPNWTTKIVDPSTGWNANGESAIRTSDANAEELSVDIWGSLYSVNDEGDTTSATVEFKIEYRKTGTTGAWLVVENFSIWGGISSTWRISSTKRETVRKGRRWKVPKGQYDVRVTRLRTYHTDNNASANEMTWAALRTIRSATAFTVSDTIVMAIRIRASDQLQGSLDNVSVEATAVLPVWNGTAWVEQITRNPAWAFVDVLTGKAARRPLDKARMDTVSIKAWADQAASDGDYFDLVYDDSATVLDRINSITGVARATWGLKDDARIVAIIDDPNPNPKMLITPANSTGFHYEMISGDIPHAFRVKFIDDTTWENSERVVYDDGYNESNAELFEEMEAVGCTNPEQAWRLGRYHLAQRRMRPEVYTFSQGIQHLHYSRGDLLQLQHDVIMVGLASGRIIKAWPGTVTLQLRTDVFLHMEAGKTYGMKIMRSDGTIAVSQVITSAPGSNTPVLLDNTLTIEPDDLFVFGEMGKETIDVKVLQITPNEDFSATITCTPAALNILDSIAGTIPPFDPVLTGPIDIDKLPPPPARIVEVLSDESVLLRDTDGSLRVRMVVNTAVAAFQGWNQQTQLRYRTREGNGTWTLTTPSISNSHSLLDVDQRVEYEIQARSVNGSNASIWSTVVVHEVVGNTTPPPAPTGFTAQAVGDRIILEWDSVNVPDIDQYEIRIGTSWDTGTLLVRTKSTKYLTETPQNGPWMIKAIDTGKHLSVSPAVSSIPIVNPVVTALSAGVVTNYVSLVWETTPGTYSIKEFKLLKGGLEIGRVTGSYTTIFETAAGDYTYTIVPIDIAGNIGTSRYVQVHVAAPGTDDGGELHFEFAIGTSSAVTGTWQPTPPVTTGEQYLWMRTQWKNGDGTLDPYSTPTRLKGDEGIQGQPGPKGDPGDTGAPGAPGTPAPPLLTQYSTNNTSWHTPFATGDLYMRTNNGTGWSVGMRIVGEDGTNGANGQDGDDGSYTTFQFAKNTSPTTAPLPSASWQDTPYVVGAGEYNWMRKGVITPPATAPASWSTPVRMTGDKGEQGIQGPKGTTGDTGQTGQTGAPGADAPYLKTQYSKNGTTLWHDVFTAGDLYMRTSNNNGSTYSTGMRIVGEDGANGTDGQAGADGSWYKFEFAKNTNPDSAPSTGWQDAPYVIGTGEYNWMRRGIVIPPAATPLSWSTPARMTGDKGDTGPKGTTGDTGQTGQTGAPGADAPYLQTQYSVNGTTLWHDVFTAGDLYMRTNNGTGWSAGMRIVGEDGTNGTDGQKGIDGSWYKFEFAKNTSTSTPPGTGWRDAPYTLNAGEYNWMRKGLVIPPATTPASWNAAVRMTGDKGEQGIQGPQGLIGPQGGVGPVGQGIDSITEQYAISTNKVTPPAEGSSDWKDVAPTWSTGKYLWTRSKIVYKNPTDTKYTTAVCDNAWEAVNEVKDELNTQENNYGYKYRADIIIYGDSDKLYPVVVKSGNQGVKRDIFVRRTYSELAPPDWNTSTHKGDLVVKIKANFGGWGGANYSWEIHELEELYSRTFAGCENVMSNMAFAIYLRGGGTTGASYHLYSDQQLDRTLYTGISPQICYENELMGVTGEYSWYAPNPKTFKTLKPDRLQDSDQNAIDVRNFIPLTKVSIKSSDVEYYLSTSATSLSGGSWQTTAPTWVDGKYMWSRTRVELNNGTVRYTPSESGTCIAGAKGATGAKGDQGIQGPQGVQGPPGIPGKLGLSAVGPTLYLKGFNADGSFGATTGLINFGNKQLTVPQAQYTFEEVGPGYIILNTTLSPIVPKFVKMVAVASTSAYISWVDFNTGTEIAVSDDTNFIAIGTFHVEVGVIDTSEIINPALLNTFIKAHFMDLLNDGQTVTSGTFALWADAMGVEQIFESIAAYEIFTNKLNANNATVGSGDGATGFRFRAMSDQNMLGTDNPVFDVFKDDKQLFKVDIATGKIYFGEHFWYDPADGAIHTPNDNTVIKADGAIEAVDGTFSGNLLSATGRFAGSFTTPTLSSEPGEETVTRYSASGGVSQARTMASYMIFTLSQSTGRYIKTKGTFNGKTVIGSVITLSTVHTEGVMPWPVRLPYKRTDVTLAILLSNSDGTTTKITSVKGAVEYDASSYPVVDIWSGSIEAGTTFSETLTLDIYTGGDVLKMLNLPTSPNGLSVNRVWRDGNTLKIV